MPPALKDATPVRALEVPIGICACGCGEEVNRYLRPALELRDKGLTFPDIGQELGITAAYAQAIVRKPPRFVVGHVARTFAWHKRTCDGCGKEFSTCVAHQRYCGGDRNNMDCRVGRVHDRSVRQGVVFRHEKTQTQRALTAERRVMARRAREAERQQQRVLRMMLDAQERREREQERIETRARKIAMREARIQDAIEQRAFHKELTKRRKAALREAPKNRLLTVEERHELDELMAQHEREMGRDGYAWSERIAGSKSPSFTVSLDAALGDSEGFSRGDILTSDVDFTSTGELEWLMRSNGVRNPRRLLVSGRDGL